MRLWLPATVGDASKLPRLRQFPALDAAQHRHARADVAARCEQLLAQMPTTFEEDVDALRSGAFRDDAERVRVIYRACKKKILRETLDMFKLT